jgi:hypothetical protein
MRTPTNGDLVEFFDGEGFTSGTMMGEEHIDGELYLILQVGNERQSVHFTDSLSILVEKKERESDLPLLQERFRTDT